MLFNLIGHKDTLRSPSIGAMASVHLVSVNRILRLPAEYGLEGDYRVLQRAKVGEILGDINYTVSVYMAGRICGVCFNLDSVGLLSTRTWVTIMVRTSSDFISTHFRLANESDPPL